MTERDAIEQVCEWIRESNNGAVTTSGIDAVDAEVTEAEVAAAIATSTDGKPYGPDRLGNGW